LSRGNFIKRLAFNNIIVNNVVMAESGQDSGNNSRALKVASVSSIAVGEKPDTSKNLSPSRDLGSEESAHLEADFRGIVTGWPEYQKAVLARFIEKGKLGPLEPIIFSRGDQRHMVRIQKDSNRVRHFSMKTRSLDEPQLEGIEEEMAFLGIGTNKDYADRSVYIRSAAENATVSYRPVPDVNPAGTSYTVPDESHVQYMDRRTGTAEQADPIAAAGDWAAELLVENSQAIPTNIKNVTPVSTPVADAA
jgi:hypothetical protein